MARKDGRVVARHKLETVGKPVALRVEPAFKDWKGDGKDLQFLRVTAVDSRGRRVWTAHDKLELEVAGNASLAGVSSGNLYSDEIHTDASVPLFQGTALVILRSGTGPGAVTLTVSSPVTKKPVRVPLATR